MRIGHRSHTREATATVSNSNSKQQTIMYGDGFTLRNNSSSSNNTANTHITDNTTQHHQKTPTTKRTTPRKDRKNSRS